MESTVGSTVAAEAHVKVVTIAAESIIHRGRSTHAITRFGKA